MAAIVHQPVGFDLGGRQIIGNVHRHLLKAELLGCQLPRVAANDDAVFVDNDRDAPAEFLDRRGDLVDVSIGHERTSRSFIRAPSATGIWELSEGTLGAGLSNRALVHYCADWEAMSTRPALEREQVLACRNNDRWNAFPPK